MSFIMEFISNKETKIKIIFITSFFTAGFIVEFFYRDPLFDNSVAIAESVQDVFDPSITFFKYWAYLGVIEFFVAIIIFLFFPISYCFTFFANMIISVHLCNFAKLVYSQGRPFLIDKMVKKACESGYGNPSGHSFQFTSNLLAFVQMFIDLFELNKLRTIIIYVVCGILILSINFSRIVLGVHSINQVILGDTFGFTTYFIICKIIQPHKIEINKFYGLFLNKKFHFCHAIAIFINAISLMIAAIFNDKLELDNYDDLKKKLIEYCQSIENSMLSRDAKMKFLYITAYYGMIYGMTILSNFVKNNYHGNYNELNYYYRNCNKKWYVKYGSRLLFTLICYLPYILTFAKRNMNIYLAYIFLSALPMFVFGLSLFSVNYLVSILLKIANEDLYRNFIDDKNEYRLDSTLSEN